MLMPSIFNDNLFDDFFDFPFYDDKADRKIQRKLYGHHAANLMKIVRRLCDELGKTVIMVLHEINYAAFYSDYICAFKEDRIKKYGTVKEVITKEVMSEIYQVDFEILNIQGKPLSIYY